MLQKTILLCLLSSMPETSASQHALAIVTTCREIQALIASYLEQSYVLHKTVGQLAGSSCTFSPDLKQYARNHADLGSVRIAQIKTGDLTHTLPASRWSFSIAAPTKQFNWHILVYSPDGKFLTTVGTVREISVIAAGHHGDLRSSVDIIEPLADHPAFYTWSIQTGAYTDNAAILKSNPVNYRDLVQLDAPRAIAYTPDGKYLVASHAHALTLFEVSPQKNTVIKTVHTSKPITALALSPDQRIIALSGGALLQQDALLVGTQRYESIIFQSACALAFSPDGKYVAVAQADNCVQVYAISAEEQFLEVLDNGSTISAKQPVDASVFFEQITTLQHDGMKPEALKNGLFFSQNGKYLACGIYIWKNQARNLKYKYKKKTETGNCVIG